MGERKRWIVTGRVQGVFFRASTADHAERIGGISGYARNLEDGSVEVVAEGEADRLESLRGFLERGPPLAGVDAVREAPASGGERLAGFEVR